MRHDEQKKTAIEERLLYCFLTLFSMRRQTSMWRHIEISLFFKMLSCKRIQDRIHHIVNINTNMNKEPIWYFCRSLTKLLTLITLEIYCKFSTVKWYIWRWLKNSAFTTVALDWREGTQNYKSIWLELIWVTFSVRHKHITVGPSATLNLGT